MFVRDSTGVKGAKKPIRGLQTNLHPELVGITWEQRWLL
jgi:hypothetical protein